MIILTKWIFEKSKTNTTKINKFFFFKKIQNRWAIKTKFDIFIWMKHLFNLVFYFIFKIFLS